MYRILVLLLFMTGGVAGFAQDRPHILVSNDDGIDAVGLRVMVAELARIGRVTVAAPMENESGIGHATTDSRTPIFVRSRTDSAGVVWHAIGARPSDSVRLAIQELLDAPADIVVSGPNSGANTGFSTWISGTLGAAREGAFHGVPAIAVSMVGSASEAHYQAASRFTARLVEEYLREPLPPGRLVSVNYPALPAGEIRGARVLPLTQRLPFRYAFEEGRTPGGAVFYWQHIVGRTDVEPDADFRAAREGYITITPLALDQTDYDLIPRLQRWSIEP